MKCKAPDNEVGLCFVSSQNCSLPFCCGGSACGRLQDHSINQYHQNYHCPLQNHHRPHNHRSYQHLVWGLQKGWALYQDLKSSWRWVCTCDFTSHSPLQITAVLIIISQINIWSEVWAPYQDLRSSGRWVCTWRKCCLLEGCSLVSAWCGHTVFSIYWEIF